MASSIPEASRGARRRTALPTRTARVHATANNNDGTTLGAAAADGEAGGAACEDGRDSGLSSESSTPTGGSPPPRQRRNSAAAAATCAASSGVPVPFRTLAKIDCARVANGRTSRLLRSRSGIESPRSLDSMRNRQIPSPLRTPKSIQSPILDSGDDGSIRIDRATFQYMCQDIVSLKTMLLKLKRVLQEPEALNPFDNSMKNGLFYALNEGGTADVSTSPGSGGNSIADELTDLRRQVIFLQGQVEDRDRSIQVLQFQLAKLKTSNGTETTNNALSVNGNKTSSSVDTCNATTQTEKQSRPVSAGPSLLQSLPQDNVMGPLVSFRIGKPCGLE